MPKKQQSHKPEAERRERLAQEYQSKRRQQKINEEANLL
jgi:hypothetical protein